MENEDNIFFEQMPDFNVNWNSGNNGSQDTIAEKEYNSLYGEMLDKCNPNRFDIESFGLEKFNVANEIFAQLQSYRANISDTKLINLRNQAIDELGITISTKKKYDYLKTILDPKQYINLHPYNKELVAAAGELYNELLNNKNDIRALEELENNSTIDYIKDEHDYINLETEDYLKKHPNGIHSIKVSESFKREQPLKEDWEVKEEDRFFHNSTSLEYLIKYPEGRFAKQARDLLEEDEFLNSSAEKYLSHFPDGRHSQEAKCYVNHNSNYYLKQYPNGRYANEAISVRNGVIFTLIISIILLFGVIAVLNQ